MVALLGLHFDGNVDATGIATVLLAIAAAGLALYTRKSVKQNAIELAQSQRPVLMPRRGAGSQPVLHEGGRYDLPVVNVGVGPALAIRADLEFGDINGEASGAPQVLAMVELTAMGAKEETFLTFENVPLSSPMGFAFNIEFADVSGVTWVSQGFYSEADKLFREVNITKTQLYEAMRYRIFPRVGQSTAWDVPTDGPEA